MALHLTDNEIEAVLEIRVEPCMDVVSQLLVLLYPPGGKRRASKRVRILAGRHREALKGLRLIPSVAQRYVNCMRRFTYELNNPDHEESFDEIFKQQSFEGFDVIRGRVVDYGILHPIAFP